MPSHRAYYRTADEARTAAAAAVARLTALWEQATEDAGEQSASAAPVVAVRIEDATAMPAAPGGDNGSDTTVRITGPDGRQEKARLVMPTEQSDVLLTKASGTVTFNRNGSGVAYNEMRVRSRIATSIQVTTTAACTLTGQIVQDRFTGKKYTCGASTPSAAGVHIVNVTETDTTDTSDVTFGTVVEFLTPPPEANPIARVYGMAGVTTVYGAGLTDSSGRKYLCANVASVSAGTGLVGDHYVDARIIRDPSDTNEDDTPLAVGDELTWNSAPTDAKATVEIVSIADEGDGTFVEGSQVTTGSGTKFYLVTETTSFGDYETVDVPILSVERGSAYNLTVGSGAAHTSTGALGTIATAVDASDYPEPYASQVIGASMTWSSRVYRGADGRWVADVFTEPLGS